MGTKEVKSEGHETELRSFPGNLPSERPRREEYQAEWTFAEALSEYADSLESERDRLRERVLELVEAIRLLRSVFVARSSRERETTSQETPQGLVEADETAPVGIYELVKIVKATAKTELK